MTARHAEGTATAQRELWGRRARDWAAMQEGQWFLARARDRRDGAERRTTAD